MSKLLKFKDWLTVDEAANYLEVEFGERVTNADIFRLALDGHLKLSVNFVNHANARRGKRVSISDAEKVLMPSLKNDGKEVELILGLKFFDSKTGSLVEVVQFDKTVVTIRGIWDLTMFGGEKLDIEHEYQSITNGVGIELTNIDGCYVADPISEVVYEIQECYDDNEFVKGSLAQLEKIRLKIEIENLPKDQADLLLNQHKQDRIKYIQNRNKDKSSEYYPASRLPENSILVVRTKAINDFIDAANVEKNSHKPLSNVERDTLLIIIAALAKEIKFDIQKLSKTSDAIAHLTQILGVPVSATTVENKLKLIPKALESRSS